MSVIANNIVAGAAGQGGSPGQGGGGAYQIERSLRFNSADSAYLSRTPASAGSLTTWTWSGWLKLSELNNTYPCLFGGGTSGTRFFVRYEKTPGTWEIFTDPPNGAGTERNSTVASFRDYSAWYHIVLAWDTTNATAADRCRFYVNGVQQQLDGNFSQNIQSSVNNNSEQLIGKEPGYGRYLDGYLADVHFIDGQALAASDFGEFDATTGIWNPIQYSGSYGSNGFHLDFSDNSTAAALGTDTSGNNNTWTVNNISVTAGSGNDSLVDTPTNGTQTDTGAGGEVRGNYCTFNPLAVPLSGTHVLSNGNLDVSTNSGNIIGTYFLTSGKWYWEVNAGGYVGICGKNGVGHTASISVSGSDAYGYWNNGYIYAGVGSYVTGGSAFTSSDTIGVALDMDGGTVKWYKNNVLQYNLALNYSNWEDLRGGVFPCINAGGGSSLTFAVNFGQRPFAYTAPSGYKALCTTNLPTPTIADGSTVMDVVTYTGNGSTQSISGIGFSPDFVWIKNRSNGYNHVLFDVVRGSGGSKVLFSNRSTVEGGGTGEEGTVYGHLSSFNADGFTVAPGTGSPLWVSSNNDSYVSWAWDAGTSTVTNTDGSITSEVRANASAGFSIVTWTGTANATVGHGLNAAPQFVVTKSRTNSVPWRIWSAEFSNAASDFLGFDSSGAATFPGTYWGSMTSTTIGMGAGTYDNNVGSMVAYCFAPVDGFSSFNSYTGNGSTDGLFVYTGFRPRWIMIKRTNATANWRVLDTARDTYNVASAELYPSISNAENSFNALDINSNGFKLRTSDVNYNASGSTYIYAAFAENPFALNSRAR